MTVYPFELKAGKVVMMHLGNFSAYYILLNRGNCTALKSAKAVILSKYDGKFGKEKGCLPNETLGSYLSKVSGVLSVSQVESRTYSHTINKKKRE